MNPLRYTSDLKDPQWELIRLFFEPLPKVRRPRKHSYRAILNGCFYVIRTGCQWRNLPKDLPPWSFVVTYYRHWILSGFWITLNDYLRVKVHYVSGRNEVASAAIPDSRSVKSTEYSEVRGFDAGKKVNGRKRHLVVDTLGLVLTVMVTAASVQDREGAKDLLKRVFLQLGSVQKVWADGGYAGQLVCWVRQQWGRCLEIAQRPLRSKGFAVQHKRWIVERTFGWFGRARRFSKECERKTNTAESVIYICTIQLMLSRLSK